jgi:(R,R)-butanediol dehydrogenase/meso-butanediol dehydrogenase/diacetyl reductase
MAAMPKDAAILVIGAGPIGAGVALFARLLGARHVVVSERSAARRQLALDMGATEIVDPTVEDVAARFATIAGRTPQIVFECVGVRGLLQQAIQFAGRRGRVVVAGVCFGDDTIIPLVALSKEISVQFTQCYSERNFAEVIDAVAQGEVNPRPMHSDTIGFAEVPRTFEALRTAVGQCKVLIDPSRI